MKKSKILLVILTLIILFAFIFSVCGKIGENDKPEVIITLKDYLLKSFLAELPEINKNLPKEIDKNTSLLSIEYSEEKIYSRYELSSGTDLMQWFNGDLNKIKTLLIRQVCAQEFKRKLIEVDVGFVEEYKGNKGEVVFALSVEKKECAEFEK
jgi:hypothetical protein